ncbi:MAG: hypothetical protein QXQ81_10460, partial [Candidatus Thorarchaeota archaeon]
DEGLPMVSGKTIRGLLRDAWLSMEDHFPELKQAAMRVLGVGRDLGESSILRVGDAHVNREVRDWVRSAIHEQKLTSRQVLSALTDVRYQTSQERTTGGPEPHSLRSSRVIVRGITLNAGLIWLDEPTPADLRVLAMCVLAVRHAGLSSTRGRGHVCFKLDNDAQLTRELAQLGR